MGEVLVTFRVMPDGIEVDLNKLEMKINSKVKPDRIEKIPIAFGLNALKVIKFIPEKEGESEKIENIIRSIDGVSEVEILEMSRSL